MNTTISVTLLGVIGVGLLTDYALTDFQGTLFLARKLVDLIEYIAFWR